jgi:hypothetical protein
MKKMLLALVMVAALVGSVSATDVICGGQVPLINNVIGVGMMTMDFASSGTSVQCAQLFINNNSTEWDLKITTKNASHFISLNPSAVSIPAAKLVVSEGTLLNGSSVSPEATAAFAALAGKDLVLVPTIDLHILNQSTATVMYNLTVSADWVKDPTYLAGIYTETIIATIVATM